MGDDGGRSGGGPRLPAAAPQDLRDFAACTRDTVILDTSHLGWLARPEGSPEVPVVVEPGEVPNTGTVRIGWGGLSLVLPVSIVDGELRVDVPRVYPDDVVRGVGEWVGDFNGVMRRNGRRLESMRHEGHRIHLAKRAVTVPPPTSPTSPTSSARPPAPLPPPPAGAPVVPPPPAAPLPATSREGDDSNEPAASGARSLLWVVVAVLVAAGVVIVAWILTRGDDELAVTADRSDEPRDDDRSGPGALPGDTASGDGSGEGDDVVPSLPIEPETSAAPEPTEPEPPAPDPPPVAGADGAGAEELVRFWGRAWDAMNERTGLAAPGPDPGAFPQLIGVDMTGDLVACRGDGSPAPDAIGADIVGVQGRIDTDAMTLEVFMRQSPMVSDQSFSWAVVNQVITLSGSQNLYLWEINDGERRSGRLGETGELLDDPAVTVAIDDSAVRFSVPIRTDDPPVALAAQAFVMPVDGDETGCDVLRVVADPTPLPPIAGAGGCTPDPAVGCLGEGRLSVSVTDAGDAPMEPSGLAVTDAELFAVGDVAVLVRVLNGCGLNGAYWVFHSGTGGDAYALTVTDADGTARTYANPLGDPAAPVLDTAAFAACP